LVSFFILFTDELLSKSRIKGKYSIKLVMPLLAPHMANAYKNSSSSHHTRTELCWFWLNRTPYRSLGFFISHFTAVRLKKSTA